ncbi:MAG: hypothetical protein P8144_09685 [Gammaproteobacteria bacterium]
MRGDAGIDTLYGQAGDDRLEGGADRDALYGDVGDDVFIKLNQLKWVMLFS